MLTTFGLLDVSTGKTARLNAMLRCYVSREVSVAASFFSGQRYAEPSKKVINETLN